MLVFQGVSRTSDGKLRVIGIAAGTALPSGAVVTAGLAKSSDGYLYVVIS